MNQTAYNFNSFYKRWALITSIINLAGIFLSYLFDLQILWKVSIISSFAFFLFKMPSFLTDMPFFLGYANWVSIFRLVIVISLFIFYKKINESILFSAFLFAILLDGLDGYLARKFGHISNVGGMLDMETDAMLVLVLSWIHVDSKSIGWWILIPGGFRYIYGLLFSWLDSGTVDYPPKKVRATIAVIFFFALLTPFITHRAISTYVLGFASLLILISFSLSISNYLYD